MLNKTRRYKLSKNHSIFLTAIVFAFIVMVSLLLKQLLIGSIVGLIISTIYHLYAKNQNPGKLQHYFKYNSLPVVLSGNKRRGNKIKWI